jgi:hypothetical protein
MDEKLEFAKQLLDEWKYRHENFWKIVYRYLLAIAGLATIPFVKPEIFNPIVKGWSKGVYISLPIIIFIVLCFVLTSEHARLSAVETKLKSIRSTYAPPPFSRWEMLKERIGVAILFIGIGLLLLGFWAFRMICG